MRPNKILKRYNVNVIDIWESLVDRWIGRSHLLTGLARGRNLGVVDTEGLGKRLEEGVDVVAEETFGLDEGRGQALHDVEMDIGEDLVGRMSAMLVRRISGVAYGSGVEGSIGGPDTLLVGSGDERVSVEDVGGGGLDEGEVTRGRATVPVLGEGLVAEEGSESVGIDDIVGSVGEEVDDECSLIVGDDHASNAELELRIGNVSLCWWEGFIVGSRWGRWPALARSGGTCTLA